ncbi:MAG: hypothetical protein SFU83_19020 [Meiothermus sp.]|nr:hypothetical protein [Meiothermus sp.]
MSATITPKSDVPSQLHAARALVQELRLSKPVTNTADGRLLISGDEYVLVRKEVMDNLGHAIGDLSADIVSYKLGYLMGELEAKKLISSGKVPEEPLMRCLMRPFVYMASGLGTVDILELHYDGNPKNFYVLYEDLRPVAPRLVMGFSAGWKSHMLGVQLEAKTIEHSGAGIRVLVAPRMKILTDAPNPRFSQPRNAFEITPIRL